MWIADKKIFEPHIITYKSKTIGQDVKKPNQIGFKEKTEIEKRLRT